MIKKINNRFKLNILFVKVLEVFIASIKYILNNICKFKNENVVDNVIGVKDPKAQTQSLTIIQ